MIPDGCVAHYEEKTSGVASGSYPAAATRSAPVISIAISSQKGGVGKTTLSINLAHAFARAGVRTLLVDGDPQGSVGLSLTRQSRQLTGFYDYLNQPSLPLERLIVPTRMDTFSLVASGQGSDYDAGSVGAHLSRIRALLRQADQAGYGICLIDTAAGLYGVTSDVISSSDALMIPQQAEPLGIRSVPKLLESLNQLRITNPHLTMLGICLTMVHSRLAESLEAAAALRGLLPDDMVFKTQIPRDDLFVRASARGLPVGALQEGLGAQSVFDALRKEVDSKLHSARSHGITKAG